MCKPLLIVENRPDGVAIVKKYPDGHRSFIARFVLQPDGSLVRTLDIHNCGRLRFETLDCAKKWYGIVE